MNMVWLQKNAYTRILEETIRKMPYETGGVLVGYWGGAGEAVVTAIIGPGPKAIHKKESFVPDYDHDKKEIAQHYERSGYTETYLGDWHTHPYAAAYLSELDKKTLKRIADFEPARLEKPLMMILGTQPFNLRVWAHTYAKRRCMKKSTMVPYRVEFC